MMCIKQQLFYNLDIADSGGLVLLESFNSPSLNLSSQISRWRREFIYVNLTMQELGLNDRVEQPFESHHSKVSSLWWCFWGVHWGHFVRRIV